MPAVLKFFPYAGLMLVLLLSGTTTIAQSPEELRAKIEERNKQKQALEAEIAAFEQQLATLGKQKQTLQNTIKQLDLTRQKLTKNISLTQTKIAEKDLEISQLSGDISSTGTRIDKQVDGVRKSLRTLYALDQEPVAIAMLGEMSLSTFFDDIVGTLTLKQELEDQIGELRQMKSGLETSREVAQEKREELAALKLDLAGQQKALDSTRAEQQRLLKDTQNKESAYQASLAEKRELHEQFEQELRDFENQLRIAIDPSSIPKYGSGVLAWPLDKVRITQYFGNTPFATQNPQIYSNKGHNGIDLAASIGTRIKAARGGVVKGVGNTDEQRGCYSYGKWVLVEHGNGLSTLYAHLSSISVSPGQQVGTGQVLGYSGNTGYSTGPHLHFAVFATQGVQVTRFTNSINCKNVSIPIADPKAYLNPLSYL